jgi:hypothetical protein
MFLKVLMAIVSVLSFGANSLPAAESEGRWHVIGGPALSSLSVPVTSGHREMRFGFSAGIGYEARFGKSASLLVRALFKTGGVHIDLGPTSDMTYAGSALSLPVFLKLSLGQGRRPYVLIGGYGAFLLSARVETDSGEDSRESAILRRDRNSLTAGLGAGVGWEFSIGRNALFVEAVYLMGLTNLAAGSLDAVRASSINLAVGYAF